MAGCPVRVALQGSSKGKTLVRVVEAMKRQSDLSQVITAGNSSPRLTRCLNGRQQQGDQASDDRNDHQQLDERKSPRP